jgi:hypothetical protein
MEYTHNVDAIAKRNRQLESGIGSLLSEEEPTSHQ